MKGVRQAPLFPTQMFVLVILFFCGEIKAAPPPVKCQMLLPDLEEEKKRKKKLVGVGGSAGP